MSTHKLAIAVLFASAVFAAPSGGIVMAESVHFDQDAAGKAPTGWICGVTGKGKPLWNVEADASAPSKPNVLRVEFGGTNIKVYLNGKRYIDVNDKRISGPGAVGVWTKADSVTAFDDFSFGRLSPK